ncbi:MAG: cation transporter [Clostridiaceae bacterium]|nr:cation transporter [Clostridiaceae bacterium]
MGVNEKRGKNTLLASVLLSAPGPLVLGIALFFGSSTTQIADFVRRTVEFMATLISWYVFRMTANLPKTDGLRIKLERRVDLYVGIAMLISGITMGFLAVSGFLNQSEKGNIIPALIIAVLGVISNAILAVNYSISYSKTKNTVLKAQKTLYFTKSIVDVCVSTALVAVILLNGTAMYIADLIGGIIVALVLFLNGIKLLHSRVSTK